MRKILLSLVFTAWMGLAWAATPKQVVLQVENMTCPACSITIEKALDTVPGVTAKRIDTRAATVTVAFDAERTNAAAIAKAITDAGFPATAKAKANGGRGAVAKHAHVPDMRAPGDRNHAHYGVPILLRVLGLPHAPAPENRRLLRVLFLRHGTVPAHPAT